MKGFAPIPAGDEAETTTSLEIGTYATYLNEDDDDLQAVIETPRARHSDSSSGLHPVDIPVDVVEVAFDAHRVARPDPRREQPTLLVDEVDTERRPQISSSVRFKELVAEARRRGNDDDVPTVTSTAELMELQAANEAHPADNDKPTLTVEMNTMQSATAPKTNSNVPVHVAEVYRQLETVPLAAAVVKFAIESVEARAAARAAGRPMPSPLPPPPPTQAPQTPVMAPAPGVPFVAPPPQMLYAPAPLPAAPRVEEEPPPRSLAMEIAIGVFTFIAVSAPAFWYFFLRH